MNIVKPDRLILIVDDEVAIRDMIGFNLKLAGFDYVEAEDERSTFISIAAQRPSLILLDWMLPGVSGIEIAKRLKKDPVLQEIPIIMLTAKAEEDNKIRGLDVGMDDYMVKPFSPRELIARIKAVLRRTQPAEPGGFITINSLKLDTYNQTIQADDIIVKLTASEYRLLYFFITHPNRVYTRTQIIDHVLGHQDYIDERTIDVQIKRIRAALRKLKQEKLLQTVHGTGYRFSTQHDTK